MEIEFLAQYLQLLHGSRRPAVRVPGTVNALRSLGNAHILSPEDTKALTRDYLFLRRLESRLCIVANRSTSFLSRDPDKLRVLARRMGYDDREGSAGTTLLSAYERTSRQVRDLFERILGG